MNRAVSVISHVPLVQEAIPNGFCIRKHLAGSSVETTGDISMQPRLIKRRARTRRLSNNTERGNSYRHPCPCCGSPTITVRMPNGGWMHFEGAEGLERVKHPCMHLGEGLSKKRDERTLDMFAHQAAG
jgi:hypothetical protein